MRRHLKERDTTRAREEKQIWREAGQIPMHLRRLAGSHRERVSILLRRLVALLEVHDEAVTMAKEAPHPLLAESQQRRVESKRARIADALDALAYYRVDVPPGEDAVERARALLGQAKIQLGGTTAAERLARVIGIRRRRTTRKRPCK